MRAPAIKTAAGIGCVVGLGLVLMASLAGCSGESRLVGADAAKSPAVERASRRAYDGAPPVIPHENFGMDCVSCHDAGGVEVPGVGFSPPSPHDLTPGLSTEANCRQCHVFIQTPELFVASRFTGMPQDLRRGERLFEGAPPVIPHKLFMREDCNACHTGTAAREEIRTSHPERARCRQCHAAQLTTEPFHVEAFNR